MSDLTPFDEITAKLPQLSPFQALWNEAEELLRATHPEGFDVLEIGRMAWEELPEEEKPAALDALFYCWWAALQSDRERRAAFEAVEGQR
ncbi:hypothetical protein [Streptomyces sp. NPDC006355]|uniref:hypothetical protein n=1 Tax=Streptomyces sp. NPDC006355 TaxID=3156758 RepID=UPI0033A754CE